MGTLGRAEEIGAGCDVAEVRGEFTLESGREGWFIAVREESCGRFEVVAASWGLRAFGEALSSLEVVLWQQPYPVVSITMFI